MRSGKQELRQDEVIETRREGDQPAGIYWDELPQAKIDAIPVLAALKEA